MQRKSFPIRSLKVLDSAQGVIEAVVSVFGVVDYAGERVLPGFFAESIRAKLPKGVWGHDWLSPVAKTLVAEEWLPGDSRLPQEIRQFGGLYVKGQFNLDTQRGHDAFSDLQFGAIDEFSIGYEVTEDRTAKGGVRELVKGTLFEWSPVLVGANPATSLISTKGAKTMRKIDLKALFLGEHAETDASVAAIRSLCDDLFYHCIYPCLYPEWYDRGQEMADADALACLEGGLAEFGQLALMIFRNMLAAEAAGDAAEKGARAAAFKAAIKAGRKLSQETIDSLTDIKGRVHACGDDLGALMEEACAEKARQIEVKGVSGAPPAGASFETQLDAALATVKSIAARGGEILALRAKDGRTLSSERRAQLKALGSVISDLVSAAEPAPPGWELRALQADVLRSRVVTDRLAAEARL